MCSHPGLPHIRPPLPSLLTDKYVNLPQWHLHLFRSGTNTTVPSSLRTIPLVDIVDSFDIFHTGQGSQGLLERPSKQELDTVFGSSNHNDIVPLMLEKGRIITGDAVHKYNTKNSTNAGGNQTSRGAVGGGR